MPDLSVIIPARQEEWLGKTVETVLAAIRADTEVIVILDGAWPDPGLPQHPRVTVIYHPESVGQRAATNHGARIARSPYVMKLDAHCSIDDGFDAALLNGFELLGEHVVQVPAQRNLHVFDWACTQCGFRKYQGPTITECPECHAPMERDIKWQPRRGTTTTAWRFDETLHFQYDKAAQKAQTGDYPETLSLLGACWAVSRDWFLGDLGGLDEAHGSWGQMGTEIACKAWLSGGRVVCNRTTWFAQLFRTQGGDFGFPYPQSGNAQEAAKEYSRNLWRTNAWPGQVKPLADLVRKFWPVEGWSAAALTALPAELPMRVPTTGVASTAGVLYYSDCRGDADLLAGARTHLRRVTAGHPLVAVTLAQTDNWGADLRIVVPAERGYLTMAQQILRGLKALDTDVVFFAEHDCLYPGAAYFDWRPSSDLVYGYAGHTWKVSSVTGQALHYRCEQLSGLCANRELLIDHFSRRVAHLEAHGFTRRVGFEPGKPTRHGGLDDIPRETWWNERPIIDIRHGHNLTPSRWRKDQFRNQRYTDGWTEAETVPGWGQTGGRFAEWFAEVVHGDQA